MAATFDKTISVMGDRRVVFGTITMTSVTSGAVASGLNYIVGGGFAYDSYTSNVPNAVVMFNRSSANSTLNGYILVQTCTAGDTFKIFAIGE